MSHQVHDQSSTRDSFESIDGCTVRVEPRLHGKADLVVVDPITGEVESRLSLMGDDLPMVRSLLASAEQATATA